MTENNIPLVAVVGPTASGKTALAVHLAQRFGGEIVSADSMQIYRRMNIATAKPTPDEMGGVVHHMLDFLDPSQMFSVADYTAMAHATIAEIHQRGHLPILAGGTGLYVDSVIENVSFQKIATDPKVRTALSQLAQEKGGTYLLELLREFDPESAEKLHPNNLPRLIRAIEVYRLTGIPISEHQRQSKTEPSRYRSVLIGLNYRDRQKLYNRIDARVDYMLEAGLLDEAREILADPSLKTASQAIGYKELKDYFNGKESLSDAVAKIKQESRRYAKRQLTWFRRNSEIQWLYFDDYSDPGLWKEAAEQKVRELL